MNAEVKAINSKLNNAEERISFPRGQNKGNHSIRIGDRKTKKKKKMKAI